ncbi:LamG-like jellyroll fold domain-containing protein [Pedobacter glucosidilyticus]|uniref:LamG-like jellyroll fold domain-containing protein n=1 Tax=Pedobacter glucosidilyticus TaxID=1122941 RepID=UPI00047A0187|nr:LamG-like jellyroll fold domain-containing protein [Pedobacter glucosidilyticus]
MKKFLSNRFHYIVLITVMIFFLHILNHSANAQAPVVEYTFDGTLNNSSDNTPFSGTASYTTNRNNESNKALSMNFTERIAAITGIPLGKANRSVSLWFRITNINNGTPFPALFAYGQNLQYQKFGFYLNGLDGIVHQGFAYDNTVNSVTTNLNQWYHLVVSYDNEVVKVYINNVLRMNIVRTLINTTAGNFTIGGNFTGAIDDLKIYDYALTTNQIADMFNNNPPVFSNISPRSLRINEVDIDFTISNGANITGSLIRFGTSPTALTASTSLLTGVPPISGLKTLTGLSPNTTYYYQLEATNSFATSQSEIYSFTTSSADVVANFPFESTLRDISGTMQFNNTGSYSLDRNNELKAVASVGERTATIPNLPVGNADRTISVWYNISSFVSAGFYNIFSYGSNNANQTFGMYLEKDGTVGKSLIFQANTNDVATNFTSSLNNWYHLVVTLQSGEVKIYVNNVLIRVLTPVQTLNTQLSTFRLGSDFNGAMDDLKIYNRALSAAEVTNLYNVNTLPVSLKSFTAKAQNNSAILNWQTSSENNNSHFMVKRSTNGVNFDNLAIINTKSANGASYNYIDYQPANGINYYQLLQVDLDNKTTDLGIKTVSFKLSTSDVQLFPNPVKDVVNIRFNAGAYHTLEIGDANGKILQSLVLNKAQQSITVDISNYVSDIYILKLKGNMDSVVKKIVKR